MALAARLAQLRKARGLSQSQLAEAVNTRPQVIGRYERAEATPSVEVAVRLANALSVSLDYLAGVTSLQLDRNALRRVEEITRMRPGNREHILRTVDALVRDTKARQAYA